ncbi:MAG: hypothetical protein EHM72_04675 [Calditrichaeota bacterium]|nr:MAG: hypothetical protein EHM72_04675 [Calditrichota bacterium]
MSQSLLATASFPYCPGCGHTVIAKALAWAVESIGYHPLDVIVVSDIGCCGLIDGLLNCHTIHGLHGRSVSLAQGVVMGMQTSDKKVIVVLGDGGATIGLQHLIMAARYNVEMTVILHNNLVYGMTGGQKSGLSPCCSTDIDDDYSDAVPPMDVCGLVELAGAAYIRRMYIDDDIESGLAEAIAVNGFALVEIIENCPSHGIRKVRELHGLEHKPIRVLKADRPAFRSKRRQTCSLLDSLEEMEKTEESELTGTVEVVIAGSAGEGVQTAAQLVGSAALRCGLHVAKKGEYPVTVAAGFSIAYLTLSTTPIHFQNIFNPDVALITSQDGMDKVIGLISEKTLVIREESLTFSRTGNEIRLPLRRLAGAKGSAFASLLFWCLKYQIIPLRAIQTVIEGHHHAEKLKLTLKMVGELLSEQAF